MPEPQYDFFISYTQTDLDWARWIDHALREAGYRCFFQPRNMPPGSHFLDEMDRGVESAARLVAVLSEAYQESKPCRSEWQAFYQRDQNGAERLILPLRIEKCQPRRLLSQVVYQDLVGLEEAEAKARLLEAASQRIAEPSSQPPYPGGEKTEKPRFPGGTASQSVESRPIDDLPAPGPLPPGSRMPLRRNPHFVGREEELRHLAKSLKVGEAAAVTTADVAAAATGMGGLGKTQLAVEFVHRYGRYFPGGVCWMTFAEPEGVPSEVVACGQKLELSPHFSDLGLEDQLRLVRTAWEKPEPRLLVFDNCEKPALLREWRPKTGGSRVLVTSRRSRWSSGLGIEEVPLKTLTLEQSIQLLLRLRPDLEEQRAELGAIAETLGCLPLALHLAGSYLERYSGDPPGEPSIYLKALQAEDLLKHPSFSGFDVDSNPTEHDLHVARSFALSYDALDPDDPVDETALRLLARAAWMAPGEPVPRSLLFLTLRHEEKSGATEHYEALNRAIALGLISAEVDGLLVLHRLLHGYIFMRNEDPTSQAEVEKSLLSEANHLSGTSSPVELRTCVSHLRWVTDAAIRRKDPFSAELCSALVLLLGSSGDYRGALPYCRRALLIREAVLGGDHPDTAESLNNWGYLLQAEGDHSGARSCYERALSIQEVALGEYHSDTALSLNNLGSLLRRQGDFSGALSQYQRALSIYELVHGPDHPDTATTLNNLGVLFQEQGDLPEARSYHERALSIREAERSGHPDMAQSLNNLGCLLRDEGSFGEARHHFERALTICIDNLGQDHPHTKIAAKNLAALPPPEDSET